MSDFMEVEGANGGSFVAIERVDKDQHCRVRVGHSCVITVDEIIPVTWLAAILTYAKDIGFDNAMGDKEKFPADYALGCDPIQKGGE